MILKRYLPQFNHRIWVGAAIALTILATGIGAYGFGRASGLAEKAHKLELKQNQTQSQLDKQKAVDELQIKNLKKQLDAKIELKHQQQIADALALPETPAPQTYLYPIQTAYANTYDYGFCTYGVASWINVPQDLGNANTWDDVAAWEGYTVTTVPKVGAVAQTDAGFYGHVAMVIAINGNQVEVREMNFAGLGVTDERWTDVSSWTYIYF